MTDMNGSKLQVPRNSAEMQTPPQQVLIASINPEIHENVIKITQQCYADGSEIYIPSKRKTIRVPEYKGFKEWDIKSKEIFDSLMLL